MHTFFLMGFFFGCWARRHAKHILQTLKVICGYLGQQRADV